MRLHTVGRSGLPSLVRGAAAAAHGARHPGSQAETGLCLHLAGRVRSHMGECFMNPVRGAPGVCLAPERREHVADARSRCSRGDLGFLQRSVAEARSSSTCEGCTQGQGAGVTHAGGGGLPKAGSSPPGSRPHAASAAGASASLPVEWAQPGAGAVFSSPDPGVGWLG